MSNHRKPVPMPKHRPPGNTPVTALGLSVRITHTLLNMDCVVLDDVVVHREEEFLKQPNFGSRSLKELLAFTGPLPQRPEKMPQPPPLHHTVTIPVYPDLVLTWDPKVGVWKDKVGNDFNLWRINR